MNDKVDEIDFRAGTFSVALFWRDRNAVRVCEELYIPLDKAVAVAETILAHREDIDKARRKRITDRRDELRNQIDEKIAEMQEIDEQLTKKEN